jgi:hypothetical protein
MLQFRGTEMWLKKAEKILKYRDFTIEIQCMWNVKNEGDSSNNRRDLDHFKVI